MQPNKLDDLAFYRVENFADNGSRQTGLCIRLGGEDTNEFVFVPDDKAKELADKINELLGKPAAGAVAEGWRYVIGEPDE